MKDWRDDILNSTKGMEKAHPPTNAFDLIQEKISNQASASEPSRSWIAIAAAVSLLVLFNTYFIATYSANNDSASQVDNRSYNNAGSYTSLVSNYNFYEND